MLKEDLIKELHSENLCTYYILPLSKLSKVDFSSAGFVNCYITQDFKRIAVRIMEPLLLNKNLMDHPDFSAIYRDNNTFLVMFRIRPNWKDDVRLFMEGKFSKMTNRAKDTIVRFSGLAYESKKNGKVVTDCRLLALEKHESLKSVWMDLLFPKESKKYQDHLLPEELLSIPDPQKTLINPSNLTRIRLTEETHS